METMKYWAKYDMEATHYDHVRCGDKTEVFGTFYKIVGNILKIYKRIADIKSIPPIGLAFRITLYGMNGKKYESDSDGAAKRMKEIVGTFLEGHKKTWETTIRERWERNQARGSLRKPPLYSVWDVSRLIGDIRCDDTSFSVPGEREKFEKHFIAIRDAINHEYGDSEDMDPFLNLPWGAPLGKKSKKLALDLWTFWQERKKSLKE